MKIEPDLRIREAVDYLLGAVPGTAFYRPDGKEAMVFVEKDIVNVYLSSHLSSALAHVQHMSIDEKDEERGWQTGYPDI